MSSVWNLLNPIRNGGTGLKLLSNGRELFGTVVSSGKMDKTVAVKVDFRFWHPKSKEFKTSQSKFQVHDQENFCVVGDKVVIKSCQPLSTLKHYYVRNIVKAFARDTYYTDTSSKKEMSESLKTEYARLYKEFLDREAKNTEFKNRKDEVTVKSALKAKALTRAMINVRKVESNLKKKATKVRRERSKSEEPKASATTAAISTNKKSKEV